MPSSWMRTSMNQRVELIKWNEPMAVDFFHLQSYWGWEREGGQHNNNNDNNDQWHEYNRKLIDNRLITMRFHTDMQMRCKWERQPTAIGWRTRNVFEWLVQWFFWKNWEREGGGGGSWWKWSFNSFLWGFVFVLFFSIMLALKLPWRRWRHFDSHMQMRCKLIMGVGDRYFGLW